VAKAFLFCLLILLVPVDDTWARATPGQDDDAWAAENNDFLIEPATDIAPQQDAAPMPAAARVVHQPGTPVPAVLQAPVSHSGPVLLYLLMSLQR
jgi:hypothetical protein